MEFSRTLLLSHNALFALSSLGSVVIFWSTPLFLTTILLLLSLVSLRVRNKREEWLLYAICGIAGAVAEGIAIAAGAWTYTSSTCLGIPYWLPFLWGSAALFINELASKIRTWCERA